MKKIFWFSFLLWFIFLWGCATTNKISQDELFQKEQECISYKDTIQKELWENYLMDVFYSPTRKGCVYVSNIVNNIWGIIEIKDYLTNESISTRTWLTQEHCNSISNEKDMLKCSKIRDNVQMELDRKIQELKWK